MAPRSTIAGIAAALLSAAVRRVSRGAGRSRGRLQGAGSHRLARRPVRGQGRRGADCHRRAGRQSAAGGTARRRRARTAGLPASRSHWDRASRRRRHRGVAGAGPEGRRISGGSAALRQDGPQRGCAGGRSVPGQRSCPAYRGRVAGGTRRRARRRTVARPAHEPRLVHPGGVRPRRSAPSGAPRPPHSWSRRSTTRTGKCGRW